MINSKNILLLVGIVLLVFGVWRIIRIFNALNMLLNPSFETGELSGWQIVNQTATKAISHPSHNDPTNSVLELELIDTPDGSWAGVGQRVSVEPNQRYKISFNYQLVDKAQSSSNVVLRLSQFDEAGELLKSEENSPPRPLIANSASDEQEQLWRVLTHNFVTIDKVVAIEIGVGLFGRETTTVEVDDIIFKASPTWPEAMQQDPMLLVLPILLVVGLGYFSHQIFTPLFVMVAHGIGSKRRFIAIGVVNILVFLVFAEVVALGFYFIRDGSLFYTHKKRYKLIEEAGANEELTSKRIHPYFGYIDRPGWQRDDDDFWQDMGVRLRTINNHGLGSPYDYPFVKSNPNQYIIGVFGGSVAERFVLLTGEELIKNLQKDDFFAKKEIIVLNFAKGGYKQPQQLLILSYFLSIGQQFDMVINIDGFNEVAFGYRNYQRHVDVSMPQINIMEGLINLSDQTTLTPEKLNSLARINQYKTKLNELAAAINDTQVASLSLVLEQYYTVVLHKYEEELHRFNELDTNLSQTSLLFIKPDETVLEDSALFGNIAETWAKSSIMMSQTLHDSNIAYYHFLQPNQHYSNKIFSEEEATRALERDQPYYSTLVGLGYPALVDKIDMLKENKVNSYNGIPIFDDKSEIVYIDNCCHYNQLGNEILADFIANSILESEEFKENVALNK